MWEEGERNGALRELGENRESMKFWKNCHTRGKAF